MIENCGNTGEIALDTDVREERAFELKSECKESNLPRSEGRECHAEGAARVKKAVG